MQTRAPPAGSASVYARALGADEAWRHVGSVITDADTPSVAAQRQARLIVEHALRLHAPLRASRRQPGIELGVAADGSADARVVTAVPAVPLGPVDEATMAGVGFRGVDDASGAYARLQERIEAEVPAVWLLDRDGVINRDVGHPGVLQPGACSLVPGSAAAIARLNAAGKRVAVVTNQSSRGLGLLSAAGLADIHDKLHGLLGAEGASWDELCVCEDASPSARKKPEPGMLLGALQSARAEAAKGIMIGDSWTDAVAARRAGCAAVLVCTGHGRHLGKALADRGLAPPVTLVQGATPGHVRLGLTEAEVPLRSLLGPESVAASVAPLAEEALQSPLRVFADLEQAVDHVLVLSSLGDRAAP